MLVAENPARTEGKEVGATGPLLPLLVKAVLAAAGNRFQVEPQRGERRDHVWILDNPRTLAATEAAMKSTAFLVAGDQRRKHHAQVLIDHGEDHIEVDRGSGLGNLDNDEVGDWPLAGDRTHQPIDAGNRGPLAIADHDQVLADHQQIAALDRDLGIRIVRTVVVKAAALNLRVIFEHRLEEQCFGNPCAIGHRTDHDTPVDAHRRIASEEGVRQRRDRIARRIKKLLQAVRPLGGTLDQLRCQRYRLHFKQVGKDLATIEQRGQLFQQGPADTLLLQYVTQQILEFDHPGNLAEHPGQLAMLLQRQRQTQDIVVEHRRGCRRGHVLHLLSGRVDDDGFQRANFGIQPDFYTHVGLSGWARGAQRCSVYSIPILATSLSSTLTQRTRPRTGPIALTRTRQGTPSAIDSASVAPSTTSPQPP